MSELLLEAHFEERFWMHFLLFNLIPDDAIYDVAGKIIHAKYFLGAEHDFLVFLFADMLFGSSFMLVSSAGVH